MSVVIGFVTPEFILICSDKRVCRNGHIHSEDFKKAYYLNNNIIFGFAGSVIGNYTLISEYLEDFNYYSDESFKVNFDKTASISFQEVCDTIEKKFNMFLERYKDSQKIPDVSLMVGGFVEGDSVVKRFYSRENRIGIDETKGETGVLYHLIFGSEEQEGLLVEKVKNIDKASINNLQKVFQEVICVSAQTNEGINDKMNAVFVEKPNGPVVPLVRIEVSSARNGIYKGATKMECQKTIRADKANDLYA